MTADTVANTRDIYSKGFDPNLYVSNERQSHMYNAIISIDKRLRCRNFDDKKPYVNKFAKPVRLHDMEFMIEGLGTYSIEVKDFSQFGKWDITGCPIEYFEKLECYSPNIEKLIMVFFDSDECIKTRMYYNKQQNIKETEFEIAKRTPFMQCKNDGTWQYKYYGHFYSYLKREALSPYNYNCRLKGQYYKKPQHLFWTQKMLPLETILKGLLDGKDMNTLPTYHFLQKREPTKHDIM